MQILIDHDRRALVLPTLDLTLRDLLRIVEKQQHTGYSMLYMNTYIGNLRFSPIINQPPTILDAELKEIQD